MSEKSRILLVEGSRTAPDYLISSLGDCFAVESVAACETALNILHANKDMIYLVMLCCPMAQMRVLPTNSRS